MRRALAIALLIMLIGAVPATPAMAAGWHSEQPVAAGTGVPEPLGPVGDIEFWAPNRGVLITAGVGGMPGGVYAYDGVGWHLYSTVCGGHDGRIAWAGPDDFWTIADQSSGQEAIVGESAAKERWNRSLCHFVGGRVVASYAEPIGVAGSYSRMNAAACAGPSDCWFAGERLDHATNSGAFHLHWNGLTLSAVPSLTSPQPELDDPGRAVEGLAFGAGGLFESVQVGETDGEVPGEPNPAQPSFIHSIVAGAPHPFVQLFTPSPLEYGGTDGTELEAFRFAGSGEELWAVAGAAGRSTRPTLLRFENGGPTQVPLEAKALEAGGTLAAGTAITGAAVEPGAGRIWVSYRKPGESAGAEPSPPARVAAIHPDGAVDESTELPAPGEGLGRKGAAGPIACPAFEQCWMVTEKGWLFHLGGPLPMDEDPAMAGTITFRPADDSIPPIPPADLPIDDSGAESGSGRGSEESLAEPFPENRHRPKLIVGVKQSLVHKTILQLAFTLNGRAHVQLIAKRGKKVVAKTGKLTLAPGRHSLRLQLDPKRWPTHLDFQVHAAAGSTR